MKYIQRLQIFLVLTIALVLFSCNQQQQKAENPAATDSLSGPGAFDRTILPILPHPFAGVVVSEKVPI